MLSDETKTDAFTEFVSGVEVKLRWALTGTLGGERGREATAEALAYGWEHWERVQGMDNPPGYLYQVGLNHGRRGRDRRVSLPQVPIVKLPWVQPIRAAPVGL